MKPLIERKNAVRATPFIGFIGVGSRVEFLESSSQFLIRQTTSSQLKILLLLAVVGFYPLWVLIYQTNRINGGLPAKAVLGLASLVGILFFSKYLLRLVGHRRIEVSRDRRSIALITHGRHTKREILFTQIDDVRVRSFEHGGFRTTRTNYTLTADLKNESPIDLAASDLKQDLDVIKNRMEQAGCFEE